MVASRTVVLCMTAVVSLSSLGFSSAFMAPMAGSSLLAKRQISASTSPRVASGVTQLNMKVFDWKRREALVADPSLGAVTEGEYGILGNLSPAPGSKRMKNRKGRGISAGQGATCGFGMRGQKSRSGRPAR